MSAAGRLDRRLSHKTTFGVIPTSGLFSLFLSFALPFLALSCSVAAAVALLGAGGAMLGTLYFLLGIVVSGASVLPEFLPSWARILASTCPLGRSQPHQGTPLLPDASVTSPVSVLAACAVFGVLVVLVTNALPSRRKSADL